VIRGGKSGAKGERKKIFTPRTGTTKTATGQEKSAFNCYKKRINRKVAGMVERAIFLIRQNTDGPRPLWGYEQGRPYLSASGYAEQ